MPSRIDLIVHYTDGTEDAYNTFSYYSIAGFSNPTNMTALANDFVARVLPEWAGFLPDTVDFVTVTARSPSYPFPVVVASAIPGDLALAATAYMPAWLPLNVKKVVSGNTNGDTGGSYTGLRPVRFGRVFLSWMPESFSSGLGFVVPVAPEGTAWTAFLDELNDSVVAAGDTYFPVVAGDVLPAQGSLPARTVPVLGNISAFSPQRFTKLSTRED